ncbi:MAG: amidohydrolase [Fuerstiella sp.]|nr:amidohydrolase [Fuerstiella sp.]MCP4855130.1 amidohydrolase [Fuerstiella sp.]
MQFDRRGFLSRTSSCVAAAASSPLVLSQVEAGTDSADGAVATGLPVDWKSMRKIDCHMHVAQSARDGDHGDADTVIEAANALGIELLCTSRPINRMAPPAEVRSVNDLVLAAMKRHPGRILGYCFLIPGHKETIPELERCLGAGMIGVKLYNQYKYSDPVCNPIVERCIEEQVPILGHAGHLCDPPTIKRQPNISDASEFCKLAKRYPEAMLIHGHLHGGGDWEWNIKGLRDCRNVYLDTSGSVLDAQTIEMAIDVLGHERIVFGTDTMLETGVGRILSAQLTSVQREAIFAGNMQRILDRRKS